MSLTEIGTTRRERSECRCRSGGTDEAARTRSGRRRIDAGLESRRLGRGRRLSIPISLARKRRVTTRGCGLSGAWSVSAGGSSGDRVPKPLYAPSAASSASASSR